MIIRRFAKAFSTKILLDYAEIVEKKIILKREME
jgi:hypothetical protein